MEAPQENDDFYKLIAANKGIIFKICHSYCRHKADRDDLAQEIVYTLWKGSEKFNPDYKFSTWMYRVALNVAISFYRAGKKTSNNISLRHSHLEIEDESAGYTAGEDNVNALQNHIARLKEFDRALIILYLEEKSYKEIAEILGISETNVATRLGRIKALLKKNIQHTLN